MVRHGGYQQGPSFFEWVKIVGICALVFAGVVGFMFIKLDAYNGDMSCLFIRCVKVIK